MLIQCPGDFREQKCLQSAVICGDKCWEGDPQDTAREMSWWRGQLEERVLDGDASADPRRPCRRDGAGSRSDPNPCPHGAPSPDQLRLIKCHLVVDAGHICAICYGSQLPHEMGQGDCGTEFTFYFIVVNFNLHLEPRVPSGYWTGQHVPGVGVDVKQDRGRW